LSPNSLPDNLGVDNLGAEADILGGRSGLVLILFIMSMLRLKERGKPVLKVSNIFFCILTQNIF
jgi:hypothetical protein